VNYAVKAAQSGDAHELIATGSLWDAIAKNDYLTFTCDCDTPSPSLWHDHDIEKLDHDDRERTGRCLTSQWCLNCGEDYCNAILAGETRRPAVDSYRHALQLSCFQNAIAKKNAGDRSRRRGLRALGAIR
jgi:hypothetical protein